MWRIVGAALISALVAAAMSAPARADWQNTRWGMTEQQARGVPGLGLRAPTEDEARAKRIQSLGSPRFMFNYRSGDLTFEGALYFSDAGLHGVMLKLQDPGQWQKLIAALVQRYGQPASDQPMRMNSRLVRWYTPREEVQYFHQLLGEPGASATVLYQYRNPATGKGL